MTWNRLSVKFENVAGAFDDAHLRYRLAEESTEAREGARECVDSWDEAFDDVIKDVVGFVPTTVDEELARYRLAARLKWMSDRMGNPWLLIQAWRIIMAG